MLKRKRIYSLAGLKVIAIWLIFWQHSWLTNPPCDLGARCCEFFFVASGFLIFYSHGKESIPCTWKESARYVKQKLISMWPIHLIGFILVICSMTAAQIFTKQTLLRSIINLSLLQSWIDIDVVFFSFNGPSWFLSSLLFCYFVTPVLLRLIKNESKVWIMFPLLFILRYAIEEIQFQCPGAFWNFNLHVSPVIRMMEYFMGMMIGSMWVQFNSHIKNTSASWNKYIRFIGCSIIEITIITLTAYNFVTKQNAWGRHIFSLWFCLVIFIFAFDGGIISWILATKPMKWFAAIQFEFYMLHIPVIDLVTRYIAPYGLSGRKLALIALITTILLSWIYRKFLKKSAEKLMVKMLSYVSDHVIS